MVFYGHLDLPARKDVRVLTSRIVAVGTVRDVRADVKLEPDETGGPPWLTVHRDEYGPDWPPAVGDTVTVVVPYVLKSVRRQPRKDST